MKESTLSKVVLASLLKRIKNSKGGIDQNEFSEALWSWLKPIFLNDDESITGLGKNPDDYLNRSQVELKLLKHLKNNQDSKEELEELLKVFNKPDIETVQYHSGSGDNIGRDKMVIDITIDEINKELDKKENKDEKE